MHPKPTSRVLSPCLEAIDQAQCDVMGSRLAGISAGLDRVARMAEGDGAPEGISLNFTKFFTIMNAVAGGNLATKSVLDVGCGGGGFIAVALRLGMIPTGIDIYSGQSHSRRSAQRLLSAAGMSPRDIDARIVNADITKPLASLGDQFDFVASTGMLEHIPDKHTRVEGVGNMVRALRPGGTLVLLCGPNSRVPIDLFHFGPRYPLYHQLPDRLKRMYMRHVIRPRRPDINEVQSEAGFLSGVSVREIRSAIRAVDPDAEIVQAFPIVTRLAVSRRWLRRPSVQVVVGAVSRLAVRLNLEPVILIVAARSGA